MPCGKVMDNCLVFGMFSRNENVNAPCQDFSGFRESLHVISARHLYDNGVGQPRPIISCPTGHCQERVSCCCFEVGVTRTIEPYFVNIILLLHDNPFCRALPSVKFFIQSATFAPFLYIYYITFFYVCQVVLKKFFKNFFGSVGFSLSVLPFAQLVSVNPPAVSAP